MPYFLKLKEEQIEPIEFLSMGEVADLCKKSKEALKKLTERGILPDANFRSPKVLVKRGDRKGEYIDGYRLYSKDFLVPKLVSFIKKNISRGKQVTLEQRSELINMFKEEREYYANN